VYLFLYFHKGLEVHRRIYCGSHLYSIL